MIGGASIIYQLFYRVLRGLHAVFFRAVYVVGHKNLDWKVPTLVASAHPNSFLDAVIFADSVKPVMHFLARGDVFKKGFVTWLFVRQFNMIPIYRRHETSNSEGKNLGIFRWVYRLLGEGANIMIFPEGHSIPEKRVRPVKKGTAWMAFGSLEEHGHDSGLLVVPLGLNYADHHQRHMIATLIVGEPILVADYWEEYQKSHARGVKLLTDEIGRRIKQNMITIDAEEADPLGLPVLDIARHDQYQPKMHYLRRKGTPPHLEAEWKAAAKVNALYADNREEYTTWEAKAKKYTQFLEEHGLSDQALSPGQALTTWEKALYWLAWPFVLVGLIFTSWPKQIGRYVVEKRNMRGSQWYLSFYYGIEWVLFSVAYFIALGLLFNLAGALWGWIAVPGILLLGISTERYVSMWFRARARRRWRRIRRKKPEVAREIEEIRQALATFHQ